MRYAFFVLAAIALVGIPAQAVWASGGQVQGDEADGPAYMLGVCSFEPIE